MTIKDIKEKWKKVDDFTDRYFKEIMVTLIAIDVVLILAGLSFDIKRINKRMIFEAGLADKNGDGLWAAIKKIGSELEPDHPGISQKIIEAFNEGFNNCHPGTTWAHDI